MARAQRSGPERRAFTRLENDTMANPRPKVVHVCAYVRTRFGRQEHVCAHWRSLPQQLSLPL